MAGVRILSQVRGNKKISGITIIPISLKSAQKSFNLIFFRPPPSHAISPPSPLAQWVTIIFLSLIPLAATIHPRIRCLLCQLQQKLWDISHLGSNWLYPQKFQFLLLYLEPYEITECRAENLASKKRLRSLEELMPYVTI